MTKRQSHWNTGTLLAGRSRCTGPGHGEDCRGCVEPPPLLQSWDAHSPPAAPLIQDSSQATPAPSGWTEVSLATAFSSALAAHGFPPFISLSPQGSAIAPDTKPLAPESVGPGVPRPPDNSWHFLSPTRQSARNSLKKKSQVAKG